MKIFTTLLLIVPALFASAQQLKDPLYKALKDRTDGDIIRHILVAQSAKSGSASKTTALKHRLLSYSYLNNGNLQDTTAYTYSSGRGSDVTDYASYSDNFLPMYYSFRQPYIKYDTKRSWQKIGNQLFPTWENTLSYDLSGKTIGHSSKYDPYFDDYYTIVYNGNNLPVFITTGDGSPQNVKWEMYVVYDAQNRRVMDSTFNKNTNKPDGRRTYEYDAMGNMTGYYSYYYSTGTSPTLSFQSVYGYDNANRMIYSTGLVNNGSGTIINSSTDTFTYTGTATQYTEHRSYTWDKTAGIWTPGQKLVYHLNTQNNIDTYYIHEWNTTTSQLDTIERDVLYYNNNNLISYTHGYKYTGNGTYSNIPYDKQNYYWQDYDPTAITGNNVSRPRIVVYPNPATDVIHIIGMVNGSYAIISMSGGLRMEGDITGASALDIRCLPPGNYLLSIKDEMGKGRTEPFIKQ